MEFMVRIVGAAFAVSSLYSGFYVFRELHSLPKSTLVMLVGLIGALVCVKILSMYKKEKEDDQ